MAVADRSPEGLLALAGILVTEQEIERTLGEICDLAVGFLGGPDMAAVTLLDRGGPTTAAASTPAARTVDSFQYEHSSGPCLDAYRFQRVFRIESTTDDENWPAFSRSAAAAGVRSTLSFPLVVSGDGLGALNLYSEVVNGFSEEDTRLGALFAGQASVSVANARSYWRLQGLTDQLNEALSTRGVIDQAKGILIAEEGCSADEAFDLLTRASQRRHQKVRQVAEELVEARRQLARRTGLGQ
ncbi:MAG: ANTAR domain-containing protein [Acidimicrobiales bacterium]